MTRVYDTSSTRIPTNGGKKAANNGDAYLDQAVVTSQPSLTAPSPEESVTPSDPDERVVDGAGTSSAVGNACGQVDITEVVAPARVDLVQEDITTVVAPVREDSVTTEAPGSCGADTTKVVTHPADAEKCGPDALVPHGTAEKFWWRLPGEKFVGRDQSSYEAPEFIGGMSTPEGCDMQSEDDWSDSEWERRATCEDYSQVGSKAELVAQLLGEGEGWEEEEEGGEDGEWEWEEEGAVPPPPPARKAMPMRCACVPGDVAGDEPDDGAKAKAAAEKAAAKAAKAQARAEAKAAKAAAAAVAKEAKAKAAAEAAKTKADAKAKAAAGSPKKASKPQITTAAGGKAPRGRRGSIGDLGRAAFAKATGKAE